MVKAINKFYNILKKVLANCLFFLIGSFFTFGQNKGLLFSHDFMNVSSIKDTINGEFFMYMSRLPYKPNLDTIKPSSLTGIIDSGVMWDHPQLSSFIVDTKDFTGTNIYDSIGHGTSVTLRCARFDTLSNGKIAYSGLIIAKVINTYKDNNMTIETVIDAIKWLAKKKVKIINISAGFPYNKEDEKKYIKLCKVIKSNKSILFVIAASNFSNLAVYPACCKCKNQITVGDGSLNHGDCVDKNVPIETSVAPSKYLADLANNKLHNFDTLVAIDYLSRAYKLDKTNEYASWLIYLYMKKDDMNKAEEVVNVQLKIDKNFNLLYYAGKIQQRKNETVSAINYYKDALQYETQNQTILYDTYNNLVGLLNLTGDYCLALKYLNDEYIKFPNEEEFSKLSYELMNKCN